MLKTNVLIHFYVIAVVVLVTGVSTSILKAFNNPLNNKAVDVFLVVDETNLYMSSMQLGLMKTALNNIAVELNPSGSSPYFGVFFYGASSSVNFVASFPTYSAVAVKAKLDQKQYTATQSNPSTLTTTLTQIDSICQSSCRPSVPRVIVIFSSIPDTSAESTIRQLERTRGVTVLVVGIGLTASQSSLNRLASHPTQYYAISVASHYELILAAAHIASVTSDVPRLLDINTPLHISSTSSGVYYTIQLNTYASTTINDSMVMFALNCPSCSVYGSLSEPNPISDNTIANTKRQNFYAASGYPNSLYFFRIPKSTGRFYVSFLGTGMYPMTILANVFSTPSMMSI